MITKPRICHSPEHNRPNELTSKLVEIHREENEDEILSFVSLYPFQFQQCIVNAVVIIHCAQHFVPIDSELK